MRIEQKPVKIVEHAGYDRLYVIGDVHGMLEHLVKLVSEIEKDLKKHPATKAALAFVGDYIDRGWKSAETVEYVRSLSLEGIDTIVFLMGNHENMFIEQDPETFSYRETVDSYSRRATELEMRTIELWKNDARWFKTLPHIAVFDKTVVVHGGISDYGLPALKRQYDQMVLWLRPGDKSFASNIGDDRVVVHGHSPFESHVYREDATINIDTGAFYYGVLSAVVLDPKKPQIARTIGVKADIKKSQEPGETHPSCKPVSTEFARLASIV